MYGYAVRAVLDSPVRTLLQCLLAAVGSVELGAVATACVMPVDGCWSSLAILPVEVCPVWRQYRCNRTHAHTHTCTHTRAHTHTISTTTHLHTHTRSTAHASPGIPAVADLPSLRKDRASCRGAGSSYSLHSVNSRTVRSADTQPDAPL